MMTNSASLLLVELERLDDRAPAGRQVVMRNELMRNEWRRLQRTEPKATEGGLLRSSRSAAIALATRTQLRTRADPWYFSVGPKC